MTTAELVVSGQQADVTRLRAADFHALGLAVSDAWVVRPHRLAPSSVELHIVGVPPMPGAAAYAVLVAEHDQVMLAELREANLPTQLAIGLQVFAPVALPNDGAMRSLCRHVARLAAEGLLVVPDVWTTADRSLWSHTVAVLADCITVDLVSTKP